MTITCMSERSGIASTLLCNVAQTPAPTNTAVTSSTSSLLRIENSMSLAIIASVVRCQLSIVRCELGRGRALFAWSLECRGEAGAGGFERRAGGFQVLRVGPLGG